MTSFKAFDFSPEGLAAFDEARASRPSLCQSAGVPQTLLELRTRWFSVHRLAFAHFLLEIYDYRLSEEHAVAIVDSRLGDILPWLISDNLEDFFQEAWMCLSGHRSDIRRG